MHIARTVFPLSDLTVICSSSYSQRLAGKGKRIQHSVQYYWFRIGHVISTVITYSILNKILCTETENKLVNCNNQYVGENLQMSLDSISLTFKCVLRK